MGEDLFMCAQDSKSKFYIDYYLSDGLIITEDLLNEIREFSLAYSADYKIEESNQLILELSKYIQKK
jgi:hypothetical protein